MNEKHKWLGKLAGLVVMTGCCPAQFGAWFKGT